MQETIYFAGGCFWGVQHFFDQFKGLETEVGYANGSCTGVDYHTVCTGLTAHAEAVKVEYDPKLIQLCQLIAGFFSIINPYSINRQGNDIGIQYRTGIYYTNEKQKAIAECILTYLQEQTDVPIAVEVLPLKNWTPAESVHQDYLGKNPDGYCHINPKMFHVQLPTPAQLYQTVPGLEQAESL